MGRAAPYFLILALAFTGCQKDVPLPVEDYFIFRADAEYCGTWNGPRKVYKIEGGKLYSASYGTSYLYNPNKKIRLRYREMPSGNFSLVSDLPESVPAQLLDSSDRLYGCDKCYFWSYLVIEYKKGNTIKEWVINSDESEDPEWLRDFVIKLNQVLLELEG